MKRSSFVFVAFVTVVGLAGLAAPAVPALARALPSTAGVRPVITANVHHDVSKPLRDMKPTNTPPHSHPALRAPNEPKHPVVHAKDTSGQDLAGPRIPSPTANFDGISANGSAPPDTQGAAGITQYFEMANTEIAVYSKTGSVLLSPRGTNTLWSGFGGGCQTNNDGDGMIMWDTLAQRWIADQFSVSTTPFLMCVAVSTSADATGTYNRYSFSYGSSTFPDYPKMGVWPDAYYTTINLFNAAGTQALGTEYCAYDRTKMLTGAAATQQCFFPYASGEHTLLPASLDGTTQPTAGEPNYAVGLSTSANNISYFKLHVDWVTPANSTLTGPTNLAVTAFSQACGGGTCIPQSGTSQTLDSLGDRVMTRLAYRHIGGTESLVVTHSITAGSSVGARWYELRVGGGNTLSVFQQGTVAPDSSYRWMGSIAEDQSGDMALGYSVSSSSLHPGIRYTGRLPGDPAGQMPQGEATVITGAGSQTGGLSRWGDYSAMTVDPTDDCTFWYTTEYIPSNGSFNWHTRIASFKFASCGGPPPPNDFSISANPSSVTVTQGGSATSTISTAVISGSAESITLSASGLPSGTTASFNPNPINAGTSSVLTLQTSGSTPTGTYTVTVTGTAASATHSTNISLTVNPPAANDFSISANPSSVTVTQGGSATSTISTAVISGSAESITLSASGLPSGTTASFNPNPINAGTSSVLTLQTSGSTPTGTYTVTVTGTAASATHSTNISLTVNPAGGGGITNGGFETGDFTGWTRAGSSSISTSSHSGTYAAIAGSGSPTSGDSSIAQTFTAPTGAGSLSFWYKVVCPDTIQYDWTRATLRDNTTGTTRTILAKTCTNNNTWVKVTASLIVAHSYTLRLISHDDNYPGDATFTYFDDVATGALHGPATHR